MSAIKIVCLGGGSLYYTRAIADIVENDTLAGSDLTIYDLDFEKSKRMAAMGQRLATKAGNRFNIRPTRSLADAIDGADFAVSSIGGSGAEMTRSVHDSSYHSADVHICAKYGLQQLIGDTCGPAGMMMGLRSIPVYIEICREMEKRCPNVILFSHSNPMAVLCRAMHKYSRISVVGQCHGVPGSIKCVADILGVPMEELDCIWVGTNHYYWFTQILHKGKDVYPELMRRTVGMKNEPWGKGSELCNELSQIYGYRIAYAGDSHAIEFYPFLTQVPGGQKSLPYALIEVAHSHGHDAGKPMVRRKKPTAKMRADFFKQYQALLDKAVLPDEMDEPVAFHEGLGKLIVAIATGKRQICIANVPNQGAIPNLPYDAEVELEAVTYSRGVRPVHMGAAPRLLKGMLEKRFVWQDIVVDAAVKGDRNLALQALMLDEMAIWPRKAKAMLDELLYASRDLLPKFFTGKK